jgi:hypothetical protein
LVGWLCEPSSNDWSPPHEKNATDRHANDLGRSGEHSRGCRLRQQLLDELDIETGDEHDADEHDDDA